MRAEKYLRVTDYLECSSLRLLLKTYQGQIQLILSDCTFILGFFKNLQKFEYQEQKAEVEVIGADGSIFVSNFTIKRFLTFYFE